MVPCTMHWSHCTVPSQYSLSTVSVHSALLIGGVFVHFFCSPKDLSHLVKVLHLNRPILYNTGSE